MSWLRLRRGALGGYHHLATLADTPENYERMKATVARMDLKGIDVRIVRLASLYQDETLPITGATNNRAARRLEKKLKPGYDKAVARAERKEAARLAKIPMYYPTPDEVWGMRQPVEAEGAGAS